MYILSGVRIIGPSMAPTLNNNDSALIEKISSITKKFKKGQIIIFDTTNNYTCVKRIIGVEDDEIELSDGSVYLNGAKLKESYIKNIPTNGGTILSENQKIKIKKGYVFVLGDNRLLSNDSRYFGEVSIDKIKGRVIFKLFPLDQLKVF